ncbi:MAG TPA: STAS domain-containing protein [Spirochaetota bacterium]|nr:STAS domain-containing protein [Spirochaetota bacterium]HOD13782.1 STAS domain-containing protein [Spirochaetota bacterium]HPG51083.1 STAS domain-containing protein [Spirochaetota bacterium]HPN11930.1 STAS domain-containing protein [Spirochaetota bacterium]HQL81264.1 STAS domain-containing protein [Spirochaetota bacterium]
MTVITLDENCGIKRIKELFAEALGASESGPNCTFDCAGARRIDCSVVQVMIALRRACESRGGTCEIINADELVSQLLVYAGLK